MQYKSPTIKVLLLGLIIGLGLYSCNMSTEFLFKDVGTLLWISNKHTDESIKIAVKETLENSSVIVAQISWSPNDTTFFENTKWYYQLAKNHGKSFMLNVDWQVNNRLGTRGGWKFGDKANKDKFISDINKLAKTYKPDYFSLGVEVNYYALTSPKDYKCFIEIFNELKNQLKILNPKMHVGLTFQLELLYGNHLGWKQNKTLETLDAIVNNLDYLGISTYPNLFISEQQELFNSCNYLDTIVNSYTLPIGISETGLITNKYSDNDRTKYVSLIYKKFNDLDLIFFVWGSIIDNPRNESWVDSIGLINSNGKPKSEFETWKIESLKIKN